MFCRAKRTSRRVNHRPRLGIGAGGHRWGIDRGVILGRNRGLTRWGGHGPRQDRGRLPALPSRFRLHYAVTIRRYLIWIFKEHKPTRHAMTALAPRWLRQVVRPGRRRRAGGPPARILRAAGRQQSGTVYTTYIVCQIRFLLLMPAGVDRDGDYSAVEE